MCRSNTCVFPFFPHSSKPVDWVFVPNFRPFREAFVCSLVWSEVQDQRPTRGRPEADQRPSRLERETSKLLLYQNHNVWQCVYIENTLQTKYNPHVQQKSSLLDNYLSIHIDISTLSRVDSETSCVLTRLSDTERRPHVVCRLPISPQQVVWRQCVTRKMCVWVSHVRTRVLNMMLFAVVLKSEGWGHFTWCLQRFWHYRNRNPKIVIRFWQTRLPKKNTVYYIYAYICNTEEQLKKSVRKGLGPRGRKQSWSARIHLQINKLVR